MATRNSDRDLRSKVQAYRADPTDLITYRSILAEEARSGIVLGSSAPPADVEAYAVLLEERIRIGVTTRERVLVAARLSHEAARQVAPEWINFDNLSHLSGIQIGTRSLENRERAAFACDCAERVLPIFEHEVPGDMRPRRAIQELRTWIVSPSNSISDAAFDAWESSLYSLPPASYAALAATYAAHTAADTTYADYSPENATLAANNAAIATTVRNTEIHNQERQWQRRRLAEYLVGEVVLPPIQKPVRNRRAKL